ncbi:MAG: hypothetical protein ACUVWA_04340 [Candidatus Oleimicrobiaceae bacterium]
MRRKDFHLHPILEQLLTHDDHLLAGTDSLQNLRRGLGDDAGKYLAFRCDAVLDYEDNLLSFGLVSRMSLGTANAFSFLSMTKMTVANMPGFY